jgi:hypothetical protein
MTVSPSPAPPDEDRPEPSGRISRVINWSDQHAPLISAIAAVLVALASFSALLLRYLVG